MAVSACGFTPALGPSGAARTLPSQIEIEAPSDRGDFDFVEQLERRLGRSQAAKYQLTYQISSRREDVGVTTSQETFRFNLTGSAKFQIRDTESNKVVTSGSVDNFVGYSVAFVDVTTTPPSTSATISSLSAERDANARLMVILADQVFTRLIATSESWAK